VKIFNLIIAIVENWLENPCTNGIPNQNMKNYLKTKDSLIDDN
jgi:hypothetical protein